MTIMGPVDAINIQIYFKLCALDHGSQEFSAAPREPGVENGYREWHRLVVPGLLRFDVADMTSG
jgi:hypothetical protein